MRTTLDIDDDVLYAAKEMARREGCIVGEVISALARRGLNGSPMTSFGTSGSRGGIPLLPTRGGSITLEHVQDIMDREGV